MWPARMQGPAAPLCGSPGVCLHFFRGFCRPCFAGYFQPFANRHGALRQCMPGCRKLLLPHMRYEISSEISNEICTLSGQHACQIVCQSHSVCLHGVRRCLPSRVGWCIGAAGSLRAARMCCAPGGQHATRVMCALCAAHRPSSVLCLFVQPCSVSSMGLFVQHCPVSSMGAVADCHCSALPCVEHGCCH